MLFVVLTQSALAVDLPLDVTGCEILSSYNEIHFTFHVETDGEVKVVRAWRFEPRTHRVTRTIDDESITFTFGSPNDEAETRADAQFVNDSFWLVPQCHMAWAKELTVTEHGAESMPFGQGAALKTTVRYPAIGGGYRPGDAYDLFHNAQGHIVAWHYRRLNAESPTLTVSFTNPVELGPLTVATDHRTEDEKFRVFFTDLSATP